MDIVHVSVRGWYRDGGCGCGWHGAHPGVLAVHVLLYIEVHGASWCMGVDVLSPNIYITMLGTYYSTIYNGNSEHFCSQKSIIIVSGEEPKSKSNHTEP
jgi:hypothetical protein